jgi:hypothetical protein
MNGAAWPGWTRGSSVEVMNPARRQRGVGIDTSLVECIVVGVPDLTAAAEVASALAELVEAAAIRILDVVVVTRNRTDHEIGILEASEVTGFPAGLVEGQVAKLLSQNDINLAAAPLLPGAADILVLVEDRWAEPLSSAALRAGGRVVGGRRIPRARIEAALAEPPELGDR